MKNPHTKQIKALQLAIVALTKDRRQHSPAHVAYRTGIRASKIVDPHTTGTSFLWVEEGEKKYQQYCEAISQLDDLIDILKEPPITKGQLHEPA